METTTKLQYYCNSLSSFSRYSTREVAIGNVPLGGDQPIRIQSMTTTNTMDTIATVEQSIRMVEAGSEYVRITAPSKNEAENLANIKKELLARGYDVPLIADIHFTPNAAEIAARIVEKVRVNPGNYADRKKFQQLEYSDDDYQAELDRIRERFSPLVEICKTEGTAMRIGTNHGSLSDRIMSQYGDTPLGMVESALEFLRICEDLSYKDIVLSMKASNPIVMVQAYRLLISKMEEEKMNYPLHIGVTEAGDGEDGRLKSAVGIGTLLEDGIGDTIRVSLTEDPEFEPPVARELAARYYDMSTALREDHDPIKEIDELPYDPFTYEQRSSKTIGNIGGDLVPVVVLDMDGLKEPSELEPLGYSYNQQTDKWALSDQAADFVYLGTSEAAFELPLQLAAIYDYPHWKTLTDWGQKTAYPLMTADQYLADTPEAIHFVQIKLTELNKAMLAKLKEDTALIIVLQTNNKHGMAEQRRFFMELLNEQLDTPVIIQRTYQGLNAENELLYASTDLGGLFLEGFGDGTWIQGSSGVAAINRMSFGVLQACRVRISKTEYISCPSCGRTLFDLQETTQMIRARTNHLKGVKISIMGCIVNGPGEMADADYGYVGSGPGVITLYRSKDVVKRNIDSANALEELIGLIKEDDKWIEPS